MDRKYEKLLEYLAASRAHARARVEATQRDTSTCDDCGSSLIQREGRCMTCRICGWSVCG